MDVLARELGLDVVEREIDRGELYVSDAASRCDGGLEMMPNASVDRITVCDGPPGDGPPGAVPAVSAPAFEERRT